MILVPRLKNRVQLTTDGMAGYPAAVAKHFGKNVDYAVLNKIYTMPIQAHLTILRALRSGIRAWERPGALTPARLRTWRMALSADPAPPYRGSAPSTP